MRSTPWHADPAPSDRGGPLSDLVLGSRLLGSDPYLVLHGGGNSSVKDGSVLYVKGSGHDMGSIDVGGFAPLRREALDALLELDQVTDTEMVAALRAALVDPSSPNPSIEAPLHGFLPHAAVLHTHADAIVTLTDTVGGTVLLEEAFGDAAPVLPYCMPGFELARLVRASWPELERRGSCGFVLAHHGLFTFGDDVRTAYERHVDLVERAEQIITERTGVRFADDPDEHAVTLADDAVLAAFVKDVQRTVGGEVAAEALRSPQIDEYLARDDLVELTSRGPTTLEHVIHTKRVPLVGRDVQRYVAEYTAYVARNRHRARAPVQMLDPMPRVVLDPELGLVALGRTPARARVARDVYRHTVRVIAAAQALGGYVTTSEGEQFDIEYWELEQAKLR